MTSASRGSLRGNVDPFIVMDVLERARMAEAAGRHIVHMEIGQPATPAPAGARQALARALETPLGYTVALGLPELRRGIAALYARWYGVAARRADSHDVLGTFKLTNDREEMQRVPTSGAHLIELLQERHAVLLKARPEKGPGMFKQRNNQAGAYEFVDHKLVAGTIKKAFTYYDFLRHPVARAFYIMFITAEIHPFEDGTGRIARIMMNAELTAAKLTKMVIPAVYRTDYLGALRAMSLRYNSIPYIRMLGRAFDFSATLNQKDFETMRSYLKSSNAFETDEGSIMRF